MDFCKVFGSNVYYYMKSKDSANNYLSGSIILVLLLVGMIPFTFFNSFVIKMGFIILLGLTVWSIIQFVKHRNKCKSCITTILKYMEKEPYNNFKMMRSSTWHDILSEDMKMFIMKIDYETCKEFDKMIQDKLK